MTVAVDIPGGEPDSLETSREKPPRDSVRILLPPGVRLPLERPEIGEGVSASTVLGSFVSDLQAEV